MIHKVLVWLDTKVFRSKPLSEIIEEDLQMQKEAIRQIDATMRREQYLRHMAASRIEALEKWKALDHAQT